MESDMRARIKEIAVDHFNEEGYHGATIRNIAKDVGCSLPMVYYYYNSKKELFHEIIKKDYFEILNRHSKQIKNNDIIEFYTQYIYTLTILTAMTRRSIGSASRSLCRSTGTRSYPRCWTNGRKARSPGISSGSCRI
jgi:AcrR family transcriptional regulator